MRCCICGKEIEERECNNPAPFKGKACCNDCNTKLVVPIRLDVHLGKTLAFKDTDKGGQVITTVTPKTGFTLKQLQEMIGGYIEIGPKVLDGYTTLCDEEGKLKNLAPNRCFFSLFHETLVGTVILVPDSVMKGDD